MVRPPVAMFPPQTLGGPSKLGTAGRPQKRGPAPAQSIAANRQPGLGAPESPAPSRKHLEAMHQHLSPVEPQALVSTVGSVGCKSSFSVAMSPCQASL